MQCSHVLQSKPHLCSAFANQALATQGVLICSAHLESPAPSCAVAFCWRSWWRSCSHKLNPCMHRRSPAPLLVVLPVSDAGRSKVSPACFQFAKSLCMPSPCALLKSSQHYLEHLDKTSLSAGQSWFYLYVLFFDQKGKQQKLKKDSCFQ